MEVLFVGLLATAASALAYQKFAAPASSTTAPSQPHTESLPQRPASPRLQAVYDTGTAEDKLFYDLGMTPDISVKRGTTIQAPSVLPKLPSESGTVLTQTLIDDPLPAESPSFGTAERRAMDLSRAAAFGVEARHRPDLTPFDINEETGEFIENQAFGAAGFYASPEPSRVPARYLDLKGNSAGIAGTHLYSLKPMAMQTRYGATKWTPIGEMRTHNTAKTFETALRADSRAPVANQYAGGAKAGSAPLEMNMRIPRSQLADNCFKQEELIIE